MHQNSQEPSRGRTKAGHPTVRSADQVSHSQEAHRRRVGSGSREGRGLSRFQGQGSGKTGSIQERLLLLESQSKVRKPLRTEGIQDVALEHTDLSSKQLAAWITDNKGFSVSDPLCIESSSVRDWQRVPCQDHSSSPDVGE